MRIIFEFRRHSIKDGPKTGMIGPKGWALAREVGKRHLRGRAYTHFFASPLWRTHQSLAAFDEGAGDFKLRQTPAIAPYLVDTRELHGLGELWMACHKGAKQGIDMMETAFETNAVLCERLATLSSRRFREAIPKFKDGSHVLIVGHSPNMELMVKGLTDMRIHGLAECEGFVLDWQDGHIDVGIGGETLDPRDIRQELFGASK